VRAARPPASGTLITVLDAAEERLWAALRTGWRDDVVLAVLSLPGDRRRRLRPAVRRHDRVVGSEPIGARAPAGEWDGDLRQAHWSAAAAAVLGCSTVEQAITYVPLDPPDSYDLPKALFPEQLEAFAAEWFARYLRNPKAWDRIRGIASALDWAHEGLIPAPVDAGAVLFLISRVPGVFPGPEMLAYLEARPVLIDVTLRRIFDVDGIKGASLAQRDEGHSPGTRMDDFVIPELIRRDHWTVDFVEDGIARALARGQSPYLRRWFTGLAEHLAPLRGQGGGRAPGVTAQRRRMAFIAWAAICDSPRAFGWTITGLVPTRTGSIQRTPIGWHASWPSDTRLRSTKVTPVAFAARRIASLSVTWTPRRYGTSSSATGISGKQPRVAGRMEG
jgi:hypothetical protein